MTLNQKIGKYYLKKIYKKIFVYFSGWDDFELPVDEPQGKVKQREVFQEYYRVCCG
jgi:hypothetical protein